jgi:NNP family nitrate/nitrite transporter-like MFS transporter
VWSVITSKIQLVHDKDPDVYHFPDWDSPTGKEYRSVLYLLPAVAGISGGTLRIPNSFMTQCSGGRNVVYNTSLLLALPMLIAGIALKDPDVPFNLLLTCSLLSGVGGGAFASSMSNISFFYPRKAQGYALGMNGGLGNLGVSVTQLIAPIFMGAGFGVSSVSDVTGAWLYNAGWLWFPLCLFSATLAFFWMNDQPTHGEKTNLGNLKNFWQMEIVGLVASFLSVLTLIQTRDAAAFQSSGGKIGRNFLLVLIAAFIEHVFMWFLTPPSAKGRVRTQAAIFKEKHNYVMTFVSAH